MAPVGDISRDSVLKMVEEKDRIEKEINELMQVLASVSLLHNNMSCHRGLC